MRCSTDPTTISSFLEWIKFYSRHRLLEAELALSHEFRTPESCKFHFYPLFAGNIWSESHYLYQLFLNFECLKYLKFEEKRRYYGKLLEIYLQKCWDFFFQTIDWEFHFWEMLWSLDETVKFTGRPNCPSERVCWRIFFNEKSGNADQGSSPSTWRMSYGTFWLGPLVAIFAPQHITTFHRAERAPLLPMKDPRKWKRSRK